MAKFNVLVFPSGEINAIELHSALSSCVNIDLFGASSVDRHGPFVFKNYFSGLPYINEADFIPKLNKIIDEYSIDLIFPTHDTVALFFAENKEKIHSKVLTPDLQTANICRSKKKMYSFFSDCNFIPKIYKLEESLKFPIFIKPDEGQGGKGASLIKSYGELEAIETIDNYVISEYLPGDELTVDCITDNKGALKGVFPRNRQRVFCGVSVAGQALNANSEIINIAQTINKRLNFLGLWFFQVKKDIMEHYKLMEISSRVGGGMCLTRARGVNLPLLSVYITMGFEIDVIQNNYHVQMDRTLINRYKTDIKYEHVYLDFDDTLVNDEKVNLDVIRFVFQCKNKDKKIHLLTKHEKNIYDTLKRVHIDPNLFYRIVQIPVDGEKYEHINHQNAIFIDNAYRERHAVMIKCDIPVFDVDAIEVLLDWRK